MQWDLTRLYKSFSDPAFAADMAAAEALTDKLSALFAAPAADTAVQLCALINTFNELHSLTARFRSMVMLTLSADAQNEEALAYNDKLQNFSVRMRQQSSAFSRYVGSIENLEALIASNDLLKEHAFVLREAAQESAHTIDPALEETVLKLRITGSGAWSQLRTTLETVQTLLQYGLLIVMPVWQLGFVAAALHWSRGNAVTPQMLPQCFRKFWPVIRLRLMRLLLSVGLCFLMMQVGTLVYTMLPAGQRLLELMLLKTILSFRDLTGELSLSGLYSVNIRLAHSKGRGRDNTYKQAHNHKHRQKYRYSRHHFFPFH